MIDELQVSNIALIREATLVPSTGLTVLTGETGAGKTALLSALDILVFPSLWEGTPLTVFEALAMGKPIVATDADGLKDVLTDGQDAAVVPRRDSAAIADAVCTLIEQPAMAEQLAGGARATGAHYDIQAFVNKMERLYVLLHETSRASKRKSVLSADLSFLET